MKNQIMLQRLGLNRAEVALAIGVSPNTVDAMVKEGFLPRPRVWRKRKIWLVHEIVAAMTEWPEAEPLHVDNDWTMT